MRTVGPREAGWPAAGASGLSSLWSDVLTLGKPRITALVLAATASGYLLAPARAGQWPGLLLMLAGTLLLGGGVGALNQYLERDSDRLMRRTRGRPLPSGRLDAQAVLVGGVLASSAGVALLTWSANLLAGLIGVVVAFTYVLCYTPLKRRTGLNTLVGAIPGALPPVLGWAAAMGELGAGAVALFWIMYVWQLPHFLSIAWLYRHDYARAGIPMLTVTDPDGRSTARQLVLYSAVLVPVSLQPTLIGMAGETYFYAALALSGGFLAAALAMVWRPAVWSARGLLRYSVLYLPLLFAFMLWDSPAA